MIFEVPSTIRWFCFSHYLYGLSGVSPQYKGEWNKAEPRRENVYYSAVQVVIFPVALILIIYVLVFIYFSWKHDVCFVSCLSCMCLNK